jgi:hypothetical protein
MKIDTQKDWASARTQSAVLNHLANTPAVRLEFSKEGQRTVRLTAKTGQVLAGHYNKLIDSNAQKGFAISVCGVGQEQQQDG